MRRVLIMMAVVLAVTGGYVRVLAAGRTRAAASATCATASLSRESSAFAKPTHTPYPENKATEASDERQIREVLDTQVAAWNQGDIDAFMKYYWRSDRTLFVGANGVTRGWQAVLDRYHRAYPNRKAMGHLTFSDIEIEQDCPREAVVIGEYHLHRERDNPIGVFTLNFRKFAEGWRIVVDHTTAFAPTGIGHK